ncbi:DUF1761 domain-containing protein [Jeotgalibacillus proteolyticus]|uniref:DUF1761 domain-containing protein n=1 Tax=Jeotgalibacillus proteolyticus TaxID=2082395 RepID=UPI003CF1F2C3
MVWSILLGVLIYIVIGMVYYSPLLFGLKWVNLLNIQDPKPNYGLLSLTALLTTIVLYALLQFAAADSFASGALIGVAAGIIVTLAYAKDFLFGLGTNTKQSRMVFLIGAGYHVIALSIIGGVMTLF